MLRFLGYCCALLALIAFGFDVWSGPFQEQELVFTSTGAYWNQIDANSLVGFQALVEKNISPDAWFDFVLVALGWPAFVLAGLFAVLFFILAPRRSRQGRGGLMFPKDRR